MKKILKQMGDSIRGCYDEVAELRGKISSFQEEIKQLMCGMRTDHEFGSWERQVAWFGFGMIRVKKTCADCGYEVMMSPKKLPVKTKKALVQLGIFTEAEVTEDKDE